MRFLHTADWHLGRILHGVHLTEDQAYLLDQFAVLAADTRPDAILIAGDIYDRAVPPPDAVALLGETLGRLILDLKIPVVMVAGNHDSPQRLGFGARLLAEQGLHVAGTIESTPAYIAIETENGTARIFPLPFAEAPFVRAWLEDETITDQDTVVRALAARARAHITANTASVLVAHCFAAGGEESESERPLSVGGADRVAPDALAGFDYVALGHLHRPQSAGADTIRYSGSLMKYSFAEAEHEKGVLLVETGGGGVHTEKIRLTPRRDLRSISGTLTELLRGAPSEDYLQAVLEDAGPVLDAMNRLRTVYPNTLHIARPRFEQENGFSIPAVSEKIGDTDMFRSFFEQVEGRTLSPAQENAFNTIVERMDRGQREGQA
jgi:DNA repair protein SbcD/Mre11